MKHADVKQDKPMMSKIAKKEVKAHEAKMHKGAKKMAKGGKAYAKGGKTNEMMKTYGRGMAKVMNQRSG